MPALPLDEAGKYVAGAYLAFLLLVLIYVAIMAAKVERMRGELSELAELAERRNRDAGLTTSLPATHPDPPEADAKRSIPAEVSGRAEVSRDG